MTRLALILGLLWIAAPSYALDLEVECSHQARLIAAIQQARLDRVPERKVQEYLLEQGTDWPENYNAVIPVFAPWVYDQKRRVIRNEDLSIAFKEQCLLQPVAGD